MLVRGPQIWPMVPILFLSEVNYGSGHSPANQKIQLSVVNFFDWLARSVADLFCGSPEMSNPSSSVPNEEPTVGHSPINIHVSRQVLEYFRDCTSLEIFSSTPFWPPFALFSHYATTMAVMMTNVADRRF